jgi:AAA domain
VFRVDGYAGSGKTTIITHAVGALGIENVRYAAFTGKAAALLNRKGMPATTIHNLMYRRVEVKEEDPKTKKKIKVARWEMKKASEGASADLIVLDEVSMINGTLANDLLSYRRPILVLGDPGQLPPVEGTGAFTKGDPDIMLRQIHRQALESKIIEVTTMAREGAHIPFGRYGSQVVKMRRADLKTKIIMQADQVICGSNATKDELNLKMRNAAGVHQPLPSGAPWREDYLPREQLQVWRSQRRILEAVQISWTRTRNHSRRR